MPKSGTKRILVSIPREVGHGRDMIRGIYAYHQFQRDWELHVSEIRKHQLEKWDGCILLRGAPGDLSVPVVECSNGYEPESIDSICEDNVQAGRMAANFYLNQGYEHFLFVGIPEPLYANQRGAGFRDSLPASLHETTIWGPGWSNAEGNDRLVKLLTSLPKPLAVFTGSDSVGEIVLRLLRKTELLVPEDVAVLGVDNDDLTCLLTRPTLSSVQLDGIGIGKGAAQLLSERMAEPDLAPRRLRLPPLGIQVRGSTMDRAVPHPDVRKALAFIRRFAHNGIGVPEVVQSTGLKRRALETHMRAITGRTLHEHLIRQRVQQAKSLLGQSTLTIQEIAFQCGFQNAARFSVVFKEQQGVSPRVYREETSD